MINRRGAAALLVLGLQGPVQAQAMDAKDIERAQAAAHEWLQLSDSLQTDASWEAAASVFQRSISKSDWAKALQAARGPLGKLKSRSLKSATWAKSPPSATLGPFLVMQFESEFEHRAGALETITPMREADGRWKVSGY